MACRVKVWEAAALKDLKPVGVRVRVRVCVLCVGEAQLRKSWGRDLEPPVHLAPAAGTRVVSQKDGGQPVYPMPVRTEYIPGE